jgi:hypothetical protein
VSKTFNPSQLHGRMAALFVNRNYGEIIDAVEEAITLVCGASRCGVRVERNFEDGFFGYSLRKEFDDTPFYTSVLAIHGVRHGAGEGPAAEVLPGYDSISLSFDSNKDAEDEALLDRLLERLGGYYKAENSDKFSWRPGNPQTPGAPGVNGEVTGDARRYSAVIENLAPIALNQFRNHGFDVQGLSEQGMKAILSDVLTFRFPPSSPANVDVNPPEGVNAFLMDVNSSYAVCRF